MTFSATSISKSEVETTIWKNFNELLRDTVKTAYTGLNDVGTATISYTNSYSDKNFTKKDDYPVMVIGEVELDENKQITQTRTEYNGSIEIEIYACQKVAAIKFIDQVFNTIETNRHVLRAAGFKYIKPVKSGDMVETDNFRLHVKRIKYEFMFTLDRTVSY